MNYGFKDMGSFQRSLLWALGLLALALRFGDLGQVPFIMDEPHLQIRLDEAMKTNAKIDHGLQGNVGLDYGPVPLWVYRAARNVQNQTWKGEDETELPFRTIALVISIGILALSLCARILFGADAGAWCMALAASSPFLFFYSRTAWDNPMQFTFLSLALLTYAAGKGRRDFLLFTGVFSGLAWGTHLISTPTIGAILAASLVTIPSNKRFSALIFATIGFACVNFTYIPHMVDEITREWGMSSGHRSFFPLEGWKYALTPVLHWVSPLSFWGTDYFFNSRAVILKEVWGEALIFWLFALPFGWILRTSTLLVSLKSSVDKKEPLLQFGSIATIALLLFLWLKKMGYHPHYLLGVIWVPFLVASRFLSEMKWKALRQFLGWGCVVTNLVFVGLAYGYLEKRNGTRADHYSTDLKSLKVVVSSTCILIPQGPSKVYLENLHVFPPSLQWLSTRDPLCAGKQPHFTDEKEEALRGVHATIRYLFPEGPDARLTAVPGRAPPVSPR